MTGPGRGVEDVLTQLRALADWHDTKATKARTYPAVGDEQTMLRVAGVHDEAARRIRMIVKGEER